jgi:REP element-mobilizing transposase RayT
LCGIDKLTGKSYEHRRTWVEKRLLFLSTVFAIDVCAYAVMSNHTHVVLHVNQEAAEKWSDTDVAIRWHKLHHGTLLTQTFTEDVDSLTEAQLNAVKVTLNLYRQRLRDISWFMRELNEPIARRANKEDECTGHFWEGRFKSQALLDEHALAACMVYVDLNPIRANIAKTPETSDHTSIKLRLETLKSGHQPTPLMPFVGYSQHDNPKHSSPHQSCPQKDKPHGLTFDLLEYIQLVELSGRYLDPNKRGEIDKSTSPILTRLGLDESNWHSISQSFESTFSVAAGQAEPMQAFKRNTKRKKLPKNVIQAA